jgi:hypothetical protein
VLLVATIWETQRADRDEVANLLRVRNSGRASDRPTTNEFAELVGFYRVFNSPLSISVPVECQQKFLESKIGRLESHQPLPS